MVSDCDCVHVSSRKHAKLAYMLPELLPLGGIGRCGVENITTASVDIETKWVNYAIKRAPLGGTQSSTQHPHTNLFLFTFPNPSPSAPEDSHYELIKTANLMILKSDLLLKSFFSFKCFFYFFKVAFFFLGHNKNTFSAFMYQPILIKAQAASQCKASITNGLVNNK